MQVCPAFWADRDVCVTGGSGFLGYHIVRTLWWLGARVRVFGLRPADDHPLWDLGVQVVVGNILDRSAVERAIAGCSIVFHTAGTVAVWGPAVARMRAVHLEGTRHVLASAGAGTRIVHTSSVVAVGASPQPEPLDEDNPFNLAGLDLPYVHAKREAEALALAGNRPGREVVVVNPGYLVGPDDHERSVMGRFCVRFWKGRIPLAFPGGINLVDVRDVALGHLLAAERGVPGQRTILGGENLTQANFLHLLADVAGYRPRSLPCLPGWALTGLARLAEWRAGRTGKEPYPSRGHALLGRYYWFYRSERARRDLGFAPRPLRSSLADTLAWQAQREVMRLRGFPAWWLRPAA